MEDEVALVIDELEAADLEDDAQLGDAVTTRGWSAGCHTCYETGSV